VKYTIAIVEDHADTRALLRVVLEDEYLLFEFEMVSDILDYLFTHHCDLVLSDISLPERDGYDLIAVIREDPSLCHLPVIAMTAHASRVDRDKAIAAGFTDYLTKPVELETLSAMIRKHLPTPDVLA
jgi:CheY-like chemotaxis protein